MIGYTLILSIFKVVLESSNTTFMVINYKETVQPVLAKTKFPADIIQKGFALLKICSPNLQDWFTKYGKYFKISSFPVANQAHSFLPESTLDSIFWRRMMKILIRIWTDVSIESKYRECGFSCLIFYINGHRAKVCEKLVQERDMSGNFFTQQFHRKRSQKL